MHQTSKQRLSDCDFRTTSRFHSARALTDDSPIEFAVPGQGDEYIDLAHTMLSIHAQIMPSNVGAWRNEFKAWDGITPVNNLLHSLFSQVDVYLNQKLVSPPNNTYAYRAHIGTLLNYGPAAKKSHLTSVLWYDDNGMMVIWMTWRMKMLDCLRGGDFFMWVIALIYSDIYTAIFSIKSASC